MKIRHRKGEFRLPESEHTTFRLSDIFGTDSVLRDASFCVLDEAAGCTPGTLAYCGNLHFLHMAERNPHVTAIITTPALAKEPLSKGLVVSEHPKVAFFKCYNIHHEQHINAPAMTFGIGQDCRIHPTAIISPRARIGDRVEIGPYSVIEDFVSIDEDVFIDSHVVVGAEGLMPIQQPDGSTLRVKHAGGVHIGKGVVILSGAVIAKSIFRQFTTVGDYTQVGMLANIGHGAVIGKQCVISGNCIVSGHTHMADHVWLSASVSIAQGITLNAHARAHMGSVIVGDIKAHEQVSGNFALPHTTHVKQFLKAKSS